MAAYSGHQTEFRRTTKTERMALGKRFPVEGPIEGPDHGNDPLLPEFAQLAARKTNMMNHYDLWVRMEAHRADGGRDFVYDSLPRGFHEAAKGFLRLERKIARDAEWSRLADGYDPTCSMQDAAEWAHDFMMVMFEEALAEELAGFLKFTTAPSWSMDVIKRIAGFKYASDVYLAATMPCPEPFIVIHADPDLAPETAEALGRMTSAAVSAVQTGKIGKRRLTPSEEVARKISQSPRHWDEMHELQQHWHEQTAEAQQAAPPFRLSDGAHAAPVPAADREQLLEQAAMRRAIVSPEKIDEMVEAVMYAVGHWADPEARRLPDGYQLYAAPNRPLAADEGRNHPYIILKHVAHANRVVVGMADLVTGKMEFVSGRGEIADYLKKVQAALEATDATA